MTREQIEARIETVQRMHANARHPDTLAALNRSLERLIMMEADDEKPQMKLTITPTSV